MIMGIEQVCDRLYLSLIKYLLILMNIPNRQLFNYHFKPLIALLIAILFSVNSHAFENNATVKNIPQTVQIKAKKNDDFLLFADYYQGKKRSGGVIILHDCNHDRRAYSAIAKSLAQQGLHALLVDLRGYGDSVSSKFAQEEIKSKSPDIVTYQSEMALITAHWNDDLLSMYQFLSKKSDQSKGIAVVTSGCSSAYVTNLAEKTHLNAMVMITPKMTYGDKERYKNLVDIPTYFITSSHHQDSYETAQELFTWNGEKQSKIQIFKGTYNEKQLISRQKYLVNDIVLWIKFNLR